MRTLSFAAIAAAVLSVLTAGPSAGAVVKSGARPCDRACLSSFADRYLAAMAAHDPARLPLAPGVTFTENGQALALGEGLWANFQGVGGYKLYFNDVARGQAGFMGVVQEAGGNDILSLRLKVRGGRITQIETVVARKELGALNKPEALRDKPIFSQALAPNERRSAAQLVGVVRAYLKAMIDAKPRPDLFDPDCQRVEDGMITANDPAAPDRITKLSCGAQLATGVSKLLDRVREPRFLMVDEERGLVHLVMFFDHRGGGRKITVRFEDGSTQDITSPFKTPSSFMCAELFKVTDGKVRQIEVVLLPVPFGMRSGWPPVGEY